MEQTVAINPSFWRKVVNYKAEFKFESRLQSRRRGVLIFGCLAALIGLTFFGYSASAAIPGQLLDWLLTLLTSLVQALIDLGGGLLLWLVSFLIRAAQYNTFVDAIPVQNGWVLVRDVANMFFIVVLLVIAFATIIGYQEFHYRAALPKLLLMAVLINFSKTLVGILIDFSQVIMLTFVSGFQAAAGGNFVEALKLNSVLSLSKNNPSGTEAQTPINLLIASLLGLGMVIISVMVVGVILIFILVRIIGLWVLLIFSPIAFFALALPGKMAKSLSVFTDKWWSRLSGFLVGGPIMAFFLWLALATVQGNPEAFTALYGSDNPAEIAQVQVTISKAAEPASLAAFLVAIVILLMGLEEAMNMTNNLLPRQLPISKIKGYATKGVAAVGGFVDRKIGATELLGKGAMAFGHGVAGLSKTKYGKFIPGTGLVGGLTGRAGAALMTHNVVRREKAASTVRERTAKLPPALRLKALETIETANTGFLGAGLFGNADFREAGQMQGQQLRSSISMQGILRQKKENELEALSASGVPILTDPDERRIWIEGGAKREAAKANMDAQAIAEKRGDVETLAKLREEQANDPSLYTDLSQLARIAGNKIDDFATAFRGVKTEAWQDSATFLANMKAVGLMNETSGKLNDGYRETNQWKELVKNGGNRAKFAEAHAFKLDNDTTYQAGAIAQLAAMKANSTQAEKQAAAEARYHVGSSGDGKHVVYAETRTDKIGKTEKVSLADILHVPREIENYAALSSKLSDAVRTSFDTALVGLSGAMRDALAKRFDRPLTDEAAQSILRQPNIISSAPSAYSTADKDAAKKLQMLGFPLAGAGYDPVTRNYLNPQAQTAHKENYHDAMIEIGAGNPADVLRGTSYIAHTDLAALAAGGQLAQIVTAELKGKAPIMLTALQASTVNPELSKNMEQLIRQLALGASKSAAKASSGAALNVVDNNLLDIVHELRDLKNASIRKMLGSLE